MSAARACYTRGAGGGELCLPARSRERREDLQQVSA